LNYVLLLALIVAAVLFGFWLARRRATPKLPPAVRIEFWVYSPVEERPSDAEILKHVLGENPHRASLGKQEGLVLSDIRFHIGRVMPENNPYIFRPEALADPDANVPSNTVSLLDNCVALFRVTYLSEQPMDSKPALQFSWHTADAIAHLTGSRLVFDTVAQRFWPEKAMFEALQQDGDAKRFEINVVVRWKDSAEDGLAFTRGMTKKGLPDLEMRGVPGDHKTIALFLLEAAARKIWEEGWADELDIEGYGETFGVKVMQPVPDEQGRRMVAQLEAVRKIRV
jgi:hypothetical protein